MVDQGVVVVVAAGNSGEDGPFEASNGASGEHVVSTVGASSNLFDFVCYFVCYFELRKFRKMLTRNR